MGRGDVRKRRCRTPGNIYSKGRDQEFVQLLMADLRIVPYLSRLVLTLFSSTHSTFYITVKAYFRPSLFPLSISPNMTIPMAAPSVDGEIPRPKDVGVLAMEVYFPRRVRPFLRLSLSSQGPTFCPLNSASPSPTLKIMMVFRKGNTQLVSVKSTWPGQMTAKTSTPSL